MIIKLPFRDGKGSRAALEGVPREYRGSIEGAWGTTEGAPGEHEGVLCAGAGAEPVEA